MLDRLLDWLGVTLYGNPEVANYKPGDGQAMLMGANHEVNLLCFGYSVIGFVAAVGLVAWYRQRRRKQ